MKRLFLCLLVTQSHAGILFNIGKDTEVICNLESSKQIKIEYVKEHNGQHCKHKILKVTVLK